VTAGASAGDVRQLDVRFPLQDAAPGKAILAHCTDKEIDNELEVRERRPFTPNTITRKDDLPK
jgi:DNA-binding IclR family transcriptional regulator